MPVHNWKRVQSGIFHDFHTAWIGELRRVLNSGLLPPEFYAQFGEKQELRQNNRVYNYAVVIWLMIVQRLHGNGSLETAVLELVRGLPKDFWPQPCKRLQSAAQ